MLLLRINCADYVRSTHMYCRKHTHLEAPIWGTWGKATWQTCRIYCIMTWSGVSQFGRWKLCVEQLGYHEWRSKVVHFLKITQESWKIEVRLRYSLTRDLLFAMFVVSCQSLKALRWHTRWHGYVKDIHLRLFDRTSENTGYCYEPFQSSWARTW